MGPRPSPGGQKRREIPRTTGLVTDNSGPSSHPYSTLYFPGKHLLSSLAHKLASNLPPHSCLVMPIRVYTALCSGDGEERRQRRDTETERWRTKEQKGRGKGSSLRATRQSQSLWQRQTRRQDSIPIDMHKQGPSASFQLRQKGEWGEKGALQWSPYVSVSGHSMSRKGSQAG